MLNGLFASEASTSKYTQLSGSEDASVSPIRGVSLSLPDYNS